MWPKYSLLISVPGAEKKEQTYHPTEQQARAHLQERREPTQMNLKGPGKLPVGATWKISRIEEVIVEEGEVK